MADSHSTQQSQRTEAEAWREIAARASRANGEDTPFLCFILNDLDNEGLISWETETAMRKRLKYHLEGEFTIGSAIRLHAGPGAASVYDSQEIRVLAALFLALEAEDELTEVSPHE